MKKSIIFAWIVFLTVSFSSLPVSSGQEAAGYTGDQCLECHEEAADDHAASIHKDTPCLACHTQAVEEEHEAIEMEPIDCLQCHSPHHEKTLHDAHSRVTCRACHIIGSLPEFDQVSKDIVASEMTGSEGLSHQSIQTGSDASCQKCHFRGNTLGAASRTLPPKSILCMACHTATFSVGDATTLICLFIFLSGMAAMGSIWFSGDRKPGSEKSKTSKSKIQQKSIFKSVLNVILLERLYLQSKARWLIHSLIFFPFLFRFTFGLITLLLSLGFPDSCITQALMDKNHAIRALFFDVTGLMILVGSAAAFGRNKINPSERIAATLQRPGIWMPFLLFLMVLIGFILEGLRIAMTGWPDGAGWAFIGYVMGFLFKGMTELTDLYVIIWYSHAVLAGAFVALIPFTRMIHMVTAPIVLFLNSREE